MVGSAVRAARRRAGVSQVELAERAGTSQPSIARLEKGQVSPTVITLDRIARALGTDLVIDFEPLPGSRAGGASARRDGKS
jgi:transcriptional regulator with XRE-family HTH domain